MLTPLSIHAGGVKLLKLSNFASLILCVHELPVEERKLGKIAKYRR